MERDDAGPHRSEPRDHRPARAPRPAARRRVPRRHRRAEDALQGGLPAQERRPPPLQPRAHPRLRPGPRAVRGRPGRARVPSTSSVHRIGLQVSNPDFGLLWVFAIASLAVYGTSLAGWASNNKFALLGGVRASSQMISYEVALGLGLVGVMMAFSSVRLPGAHRRADAPTSGAARWTLGAAGQLDFGHPGVGHLPPADRLRALLHRRLRRDQARPVRRARGRERDHRLLRRVLGDEVRPLHDLRVRRGGDPLGDHHRHLLRRLAHRLRRRRAGSPGSSGGAPASCSARSTRPSSGSRFCSSATSSWPSAGRSPASATTRSRTWAGRSCFPRRWRTSSSPARSCSSTRRSGRWPSSASWRSASCSPSPCGGATRKPAATAGDAHLPTDAHGHAPAPLPGAAAASHH